MIGVLVVTHGSIGEALLTSAAQILGSPPAQVATLSVWRQDDPDDLVLRARELLDSLDAGDGVPRQGWSLGEVGEGAPEARQVAGQHEPRADAGACRVEPAEVDGGPVGLGSGPGGRLQEAAPELDHGGLRLPRGDRPDGQLGEFGPLGRDVIHGGQPIDAVSCARLRRSHSRPSTGRTSGT